MRKTQRHRGEDEEGWKEQADDAVKVDAWIIVGYSETRASLHHDVGSAASSHDPGFCGQTWGTPWQSSEISDYQAGHI